MTKASVQYHVDDVDLISETQAFEVDTKSEFHTLRITVGHEFNLTLFFHDKYKAIAALNDIRLTCENKIWELTGMPEEYDLSAEPF